MGNLEKKKGILAHIKEDIDYLEKYKRRVEDSLDTFNNKEEIVKLEICTISKRKSERFLNEKYHSIEKLDNNLIESIKNYFRKTLDEINTSLEELKEEQSKIVD